MQKKLRFILPTFAGILCAAASILAASEMLRGLGAIVSRVGPLFDLSSGTLSYAVQILSQLTSADMISPWLYMLPIGAVCGFLFALVFRRKKRIAIGIILWILLLILLTPAALWLTEVNGIRVGALLSSLLPLLPALL